MPGHGQEIEVQATETTAPNLSLPLRRPAELVLVTATVFAVVLTGMVVAQHAGGTSTIWPANGVLLGILLTARKDTWPGLLLAGLAGNIAGMAVAGYPADAYFSLPLVNSLEIAFAAVLLEVFAGPGIDLSKPRVLWRFAIIAGTAAPALSAGLITAYAGLMGMNGGGERFIAAFFAHALGIITVTPVVLSYRRRQLALLLARGSKRLSLLAFALLIGITVLVFAQSRYPLLFLIYPPLVFVVVLFGVAGGALSLFVTTAISMAFTVTGHGPMMLMHGASEHERIILLQFFAVIAAVMVLVLSAVLAERDRVKEELALASKALGHLASTDGLTGLANRRRFDESVELALRRAVTNRSFVSLLLLDVDNFKSYNDEYGHLAGDECLRALAKAVKKLARHPGDICARYGGEELAVLLDPARASMAVSAAEGLRAEIEALRWPHEGNGSHGVVTVSIGISTYEPGSPLSSPTALIAEADVMLYAAKHRGRNKIMSRAMMAKFSAS